MSQVSQVNHLIIILRS